MTRRLQQQYNDNTTGLDLSGSVIGIEDAGLPALSGPLVVRLARYVSQAAVDAGQAPIARHTIIITGEALAALRSVFEDQVMDYMLTLPQFEGAESVIE
jgi:hypothetical protein